MHEPLLFSQAVIANENSTHVEALNGAGLVEIFLDEA